jgi:hypothetical protein
MNEYVNGSQPTQGTTVDFQDKDMSMTTENSVRDAARALLDSAQGLRKAAEKARIIYEECIRAAKQAETEAEIAMITTVFGDNE